MTENVEPNVTPRPFRLRYPVYSIRLTPVIIGVNMLVHLFTMTMQRIVLSGGALIPGLTLQYGQLWRLITAGFIHANLMHIGFNMYALYVFGSQVERLFGAGRFLLIYLLALVGGSATVVLLSPLDSLTVGASGAILGLLGASIAYFWRYRERIGGAKARLARLAQTAAINLGVGLLPQVSLWGHFGGTLVGLLVGLALVPRYELVPTPTPHLQQKRIDPNAWLWTLLICVFLALLLILAVVLRG